MPIELSAFQGEWRLTRVIEDRRAGRVGRLAGQARFAADPVDLIYTEEGVLRFPGSQPMTARQSHLWRAVPQGIAVDFADGRPFHVFDPLVARPMARHDCPPDLYDATYDFTAWPQGWRCVWEVRGPRKDYRAVSDYIRA